MVFPEDFCERIKDMLGNEYDDFINACNGEVYRGLRINTLKANKDKVLACLGYKTEKSKFCQDSYYIPQNVQSPGNHPFHHAGAFYIQEPSASSAVEVMGIKKDDKILDLCAAPGGKSTQIAAKLNGTGILWSNEYVRSRVQPLISNIERMGIKNAVVSCAHPEELCSKLEGYFDKILVDAPCSGEGMFRKEPKALENWSVANSKTCGQRQLHILDSAAKALKSGGILCYSTCTFSYYENEEVIEQFLTSHNDFEIIDMPFEFGVCGYSKYAPNTKDITKTRHIFPQHKGEGHYIALLKKKGDHIENVLTKTPSKISSVPLFEAFCKHTFHEIDFSQKEIISINDKVYISPLIPDVKGCSVVRSGVWAGDIKGKRFEPSHNLFSAYGEFAKNQLNISIDDKRLSAFLKGEEIECDYQGYTAVLVEGIPLSFGKASGGKLKNHYPKGLRLLK